MATVGQQLLTPEAGWTRYDDKDINVSYTSGWTFGSNSACYNGTAHQVSGMSAGKVESASLNFIGTKIRLISYIHPPYVEKCYISIDGTEYSFITKGTTVAQALVFEMTGLPLKEHSVQIYEKDVCQPLLGLVFDAIDIDDTGTMKPFTPPAIPALSNITATTGDSEVALSWDAVTGTTGYNVKRSTIAGGPYDKSVPVLGTSYVDTTVTNGTTYYYVVTAVTADGESGNSNEASATPNTGAVTPPTPAGKSLLRVTMIDSSERDYQLTIAEIDGFVNWYNRTVNTGTTGYMLAKKIGTQNSKEYLAFDKIISFEVITLV